MTLLEVEGLMTRFSTYEGEVHAVEGVSFKVDEEEFFGLVGETGCGKSVTALSLLGLLAGNGRVEAGSVRFEGRELIGLSETDLRYLRGDRVAYIFQEPIAALNPVHTISRQITEVLLAHRLDELVAAYEMDRPHTVTGFFLRRLVDRNLNDRFQDHYHRTGSYLIRFILRRLIHFNRERSWMILELPFLGRWLQHRLQPYANIIINEALAEVGLPDPEGIARRYPHELSGGMAQRVMVAMALAGHPRLLIADEPTTALDVTIQAQFLDLLREIQTKRRFSVLLITHNLGVVRQLCHRVAVMYAGQIIERASVTQLFDRPHHPYTRGLLAALPKLKGQTGELTTLPGAVPDLLSPAQGCRFAPRCKFAHEACESRAPPLRHVDADHSYLCHLDGGGRDE